MQSSQRVERVSRTFVVLAMNAVALLLADCGGGNGSSAATSQRSVVPTIIAPTNVTDAVPTATTVGTDSSKFSPVAVRLSYVLPGSARTAEASARALQTAQYRRPQYISPSNTSISITVTPLGGSGSVYTGSCTTGTCIVNFTANPGPTTIAFSLTDGTNVLSNFSTTTIIQPATKNSLQFTANPVVKSATVSLASSTTNAGSAASILITVSATDPDGNIIAGPANYVDANGNPISFILSASTSQAGGNGTISIQGPGRIAGPGQPATYASYDGGWLTSGTISLTATSPVTGSLTGATLTSTPVITPLYTVPTTSAAPNHIALGPDGNLWFTEFTGKVGRVTTAGSFAEYTPLTSGTSNLIGIAVGPDGNLWYVNQGANTIGKISTSGTISEFTIPTATSTAYEIALGPDGNMWFTEINAGKVGRISPTGTITEFTTPSTQPYGIAAGPDNNIWFTEHSGNKIARITPSGVITEFTVPTGAANPNQIVTGADGNLWFTESSANKIGKITPSGAITEYSIPTASSNAIGIAAHTDGALWFCEFGKNQIGRITTAGAITEYPISAAPLDIITGPGGTLWATFKSSNQVGQFVL